LTVSSQGKGLGAKSNAEKQVCEGGDRGEIDKKARETATMKGLDPFDAMS